MRENFLLFKQVAFGRLCEVERSCEKSETVVELGEWLDAVKRIWQTHSSSRSFHSLIPFLALDPLSIRFTASSQVLDKYG